MSYISGVVSDRETKYWYESFGARCPKCDTWVAGHLDTALGNIDTGLQRHVREFKCPGCSEKIVVEATVDVNYVMRVAVDREDLP